MSALGSVGSGSPADASSVGLSTAASSRPLQPKTAKTAAVGPAVVSASGDELEEAIRQDISKALHSFKEWTKSLLPGMRKPETLVVTEADVFIEGASEDESREEGLPPARDPLHTMSKIELTVRKFFAKFSQSQADKLEKYQQDHLERRANYADISSNAKLSKAYVPDAKNAGTFMSILNPATQMVDAADLKKPFSDKKGVALHAVNEQKLHENVPDKEIEGVGTMTAYKLEPGGISKGKVVPTSYFLGQDDEEAKNHLMNVYVVMVEGEEVAYIRSGKIDTKEKAKEFVTLLSSIYDKISGGNDKHAALRVVSHQLNSFDLGIESEMIDNQHGWIAYANQKLGSKADLVHINTPSNRYYHTTKMVRNTLGSIGLSGVAKFIESKFLTGERLSKEQNLDSWGTYAKWVAEDVDKGFPRFEVVFPEFAKQEFYGDFKKYVSSFKTDMQSLVENNETLQSQVEEKLIEIQRAKKRISDLEVELKNNHQDVDSIELRIKKERKNISDYEKQISEDRGKLRGFLTELRGKLLVFEAATDFLAVEHKTFGKEFAGLQPLREPIILMRRVLDAQLDTNISNLAPMSRGQELLSIQLLNDRLGVSVAMNCKSGLDRTGLLFAVKLAMKQMGGTSTSAKQASSAGDQISPVGQTGDNLFPMVRDWDAITLALNKKMTEMSAKEFREWIDNDEMLVAANGQHFNKQLVQQVIEFRKVVLDNLIRIGLPITKTSTGLEGLKWSPGTMGENLIPLNFLPSHVMVEGEMRALVNYDPSTGEPTGLTTTGRQLLTKFSALRGS